MRLPTLSYPEFIDMLCIQCPFINRNNKQLGGYYSQYKEKKQRCNILVFDAGRARNETAYIKKATEGAGRKHPAYRFFDKNDCYICEVRYGNATANALQRGLWTNTKNATPFFDSVTNGWVDYSHNLVLVKLFSHALVSSAKGHETALEEIKSDITRLKQANGINA